MSDSIEPTTEISFSEKIKECVSFLNQLVESPELWVGLEEAERIELMKVAGRISRPNRDELRKHEYMGRKIRRQKLIKQERVARAATGIRQARDAVVFEAPAQLKGVDTGALIEDFELRSPRNCYVCHAKFTKLHFFYDSMCQKCAALAILVWG